MKNKYTKRIIDDIIEEKLNTNELIVIEGARGTGKTTTALRYTESMIDLKDRKIGKIAEIQPQRILDGEKPRLIDNYHINPALIKNNPSKTIFTGLKTDAKIPNKITMLPMSLYESGESNGKISILDLFENPEREINRIKSTLTLDELVYAACRGGWPESFNEEQFIENYIDRICKKDMSKIDSVKRSPEKVRAILEAYANHISIETTKSKILKDVDNMSRKTFDNYLKALEKLLIIQDIPAWTPPIRTKGAVRTNPKRHFTDPSIASALLNLNEKDHLYNLKSFTYIFESLCIRDLAAYTAKRQGRISHYKDRYGLKADCVVHIDNGDYALFNFILGGSKIDQGAKQLLKLQKLVDKKPKFLAVITAGDSAYRRDDGVMVIPVGCLR